MVHEHAPTDRKSEAVECPICGIEHPPGQYYPRPRNNMRILISSFPKAGTNFIIQFFGMPEHIQVSHKILNMGLPIDPGGTPKAAMDHLTVRGIANQIANFNGVAFGHIPFNWTFQEAVATKPTIFVLQIRDPKDVIVSHYYHALEKVDVPFNFKFEDGKRLTERDDPILDLINLSAARWNLFLPWLPSAYVIRFEDLIADKLATISKFYHFVGAGSMQAMGFASPGAMAKMHRPKKSPTYKIRNKPGGRKGGGWREHFEPHHIEAYRKQMAEIEEILGYGT